MSDKTQNFRLLHAHGNAIKLTALNFIWGSNTHFPGIRLQMSKKEEEGFYPGPEIPLDHLNAFIGHLTDLRDMLQRQQLTMQESSNSN